MVWSVSVQGLEIRASLAGIVAAIKPATACLPIPPGLFDEVKACKIRFETPFPEKL
jgi:hypothetical protein